MTDSQQQTNPCADFGPTQWKALIWCLLVIAFGFWMTFFFSRVDSKMFASNAEVINNQAYRENRLAATSIASDRIDPRAFSSINAARLRLIDQP